MRRATRRAGTDPGLPILAGALAFALRAQTALAPFETTDERNWTGRSSGFWDALASADLSSASASPHGEVATMPGVTTMWVGTVARGIWSLGGGLGLWSRRDARSYGGAWTFATSRSGLNVAQVCMALTVAALLGLTVFLLQRWAGRVAAGVAGVLIATEPFLVAHGAVLHTDELLGLFTVAGQVTTALVLGVPRAGPWTGRPRAAALAGALFAGALLTKLSALMVLPSIALMVGWSWLAAPARRSALPRLALAGAGAFVAVVLLAYPALWADPVGELRALRTSAALGDAGHIQFFRGETVERPGPLFYAVALPFRMTPWLLVGTVVAAVTVAWWREVRPMGLALLIMAAPSAVILSTVSKQLDRYGVPLMMQATVVVGVAVAAAVHRLGAGGAERAGRLAGGPGPERGEGDAAAGEEGASAPPASPDPATDPADRAAADRADGAPTDPADRAAADRADGAPTDPSERAERAERWARRARRVLVGAGLLTAVHGVAVSPWGLAYFNPLLGGARRAEDTLLVGWGEGYESAGSLVDEVSDEPCDEITVRGYQVGSFYRCGRHPEGAEVADYVVVYVNGRQRFHPIVANDTAGRRLVARLVIRGLTYLEVYGPPTEGAPAAAGAP